MNEIIAEKVTKDYGDFRGIFDIEFNVKKGEIFGFIGTNGSGKTTTIRHIMGFSKPNNGVIKVRNIDATKHSTEVKKWIGYVPGEIAFPDLSTGKSFIKSQAELLKLKDFELANRLIDIFKIDLRANPRKMSKGMKQKTAIIAGFMNDSDILILDEPTTGLDPLMREEFMKLLEDQRKKGKTIFISSHLFEELEYLCDRVALIKDGRIVSIANIKDIKHPNERIYKIEFSDRANYESFVKLPFVFDNLRPKQNQVYIVVKRKDVLEFIMKLVEFDLKFMIEVKYNLEKYFKDTFNYKERVGIEL
jgi:ABC-2 type transport system ATP-binding protein